MKLLATLFSCIAATSFAAVPTADFSDLWWNPAESGWGANVAQQNDTMFVTLFVYGSNNAPTWYVASGATWTGQSSSTPTFTGALYQTTGPYFGGGTFNPANVTATQVGTLTFAASGANSATLTYSVNGQTVTKAVQRQTFRSAAINGIFLGASAGTWSGCGAARNGYLEERATYSFTLGNSNVQFREDGPGYTCIYTGTFTPTGRLGTMAGGGQCSDGSNQTFTASEVDVNTQAISMRVTVNAGGQCQFNGRLGGVRSGQ
jgi:hypothetical protein